MSTNETAAPSPEPQPQADDGPEVRSAADALRRAKAELRKAQQFYEEVRRQAAEKVRTVRQTTVGDMLDGTIALVRRHPGPGLFVAAVAGFVLGRWLKGK